MVALLYLFGLIKSLVGKFVFKVVMKINMFSGISKNNKIVAEAIASPEPKSNYKCQFCY